MARSNLPLPRMMEQRGDLPAGSHGSLFCPFCKDKEKSASLKEHRGRWYFKCFKSHCPSQTAGPKQAFDEVGYLAFKTGLSRKEAFIAFLKEAGVWKEERLAPSILPGQQKRKKELPAENDFVGAGPSEAHREGGEPLPGSGAGRSEAHREGGEPLPGSGAGHSEAHWEGDVGTSEAQEMAQKAIEVIKSENRASVSL